MNAVRCSSIESLNLPGGEALHDFGISAEPQWKNCIGRPSQGGVQFLLCCCRDTEHASPETELLFADKNMWLLCSEDMVVLQQRLPVRTSIPCVRGWSDKAWVPALVLEIDDRPDEQNALIRIRGQWPCSRAKGFVVRVPIPRFAIVSVVATDPHRMALKVVGTEFSELFQFRSLHSALRHP